MSIEFLPEAEAELVAAAEWYEGREKGLGRRFRNEIAHVLSRVIDDPLLWRERPGGYRRVNCPVFPFFVAYLIRGERIVVVAVGHGRRRPGYWKSRLRPTA